MPITLGNYRLTYTGGLYRIFKLNPYKELYATQSEGLAEKMFASYRQNKWR